MEITFKTIYPRAKLNIAAMVLIEICLFIDLSISRSRLATYLITFMMIIVLAYIIAIVKRLLFIKRSITLGTDYVKSNSNKKYESSQIKCIYMSYKRIGFKLHDRRLVPMDLCFYFDNGQEIDGLKKLNEWAELNNKEVKNRFFQTLM